MRLTTLTLWDRKNGVWASSTERFVRSAESIRFCAGILRDYTPGPSVSGGDDIVRSSWRHGESGRNDLTTFYAVRPRTDI